MVVKVSSQALRRFYDSDEFAKMEARSELEGVLKQLNGTRHSVVSGRPEHVLPTTRQWIDRSFPGRFERVYTIGADPITGRNHAKADLCMRLQGDVLMEDSLFHAEPCLQRGILVILIDQPWNQGVTQYHPSMVRIKSFSEIPAILADGKFTALRTNKTAS